MSADPLTRLLSQSRAAILDGGLATELEARGHDLGDALWSSRLLVDDPDAIAEVHREYQAAGADIVSTATYQASIEAFAARGMVAGTALGIMEGAVALCRGAVPVRTLVAASLGSYGALLADGSEYRGDFTATRAELAAFHERRIAAVSRADVIAFETIPCLAEARSLSDALRSPSIVDVLASRAVATWVAFSCRDGERVWAGERIEDCVSEVPEATAVGVNCTVPAHVSELVSRIARVTDRPIVVYPNAGRLWDAGRRAWQGEALPPEAFAELATKWLALGARIVGGCCGTGPAHVRALARFAVKRR